jgi:hypothetical protein
MKIDSLLAHLFTAHRSIRPANEFAKLAAALPGEAFVLALNPPFVPFTSSGTDPCGVFTLRVASLCEDVHRGKAISRLRIATGRLKWSSVALNEPRTTPKLTARCSGSALSKCQAARNSEYSTYAEAPLTCRAIDS